MLENWKPVVDSTFYEVSDLGRVRSYCERGCHKRRLEVPHLITPWSEFGGYLAVYIHQKKRKVQHLVLEAFVGRRLFGQEARHLDGVRTNNRLDNLAWATHQENVDDQVAHGTRCRGAKSSLAKFTNDQVEHIRASKHRSQDLADAYGVNVRTINRIRHLDTYATTKE